MYYRVKEFNAVPSNMSVLDQDQNLANLKARITIDCAGTGPTHFATATLMESQQVNCLGGSGLRMTYIIEVVNTTLP